MFVNNRFRVNFVIGCGWDCGGCLRLVILCGLTGLEVIFGDSREFDDERFARGVVGVALLVKDEWVGHRQRVVIGLPDGEVCFIDTAVDVPVAHCRGIYVDAGRVVVLCPDCEVCAVDAGVAVGVGLQTEEVVLGGGGALVHYEPSVGEAVIFVQCVACTVEYCCGVEAEFEVSVRQSCDFGAAKAVNCQVDYHNIRPRNQSESCFIEPRMGGVRRGESEDFDVVVDGSVCDEGLDICVGVELDEHAGNIRALNFAAVKRYIDDGGLCGIEAEEYDWTDAGVEWVACIVGDGVFCV